MIAPMIPTDSSLEARDVHGRAEAAERADLVRRGRGGRVIREIVAGYDSLVTRLYSRIRFTILRQPFLEEIGQYLPARGRVLDLGCGFGLFSLYFAAMAPERRLEGVDLSRSRIEQARRCARRLGLENVHYEARDVVEWTGHGEFDAIYFLDLVHHLPRSEVYPFLVKVRSMLAPDGILVIKDVADTPRAKRWFTLALDRLMVGLEPIYYWPPSKLQHLLEDLGFEVHRHRMTDILPYPHILYVARPRSSDRDAVATALPSSS